MKKTWILLTLIFFIGVSFVSAQQDQQGAQEPRAQAPGQARRTQRQFSQRIPGLFNLLRSEQKSELNLSDEQDEKISAILTTIEKKRSDYDEQMKKIRELSQKSSLENRKANEEIIEILTPEQRNKVEELNKTRREQRQKRNSERRQQTEQNRKQRQQQPAQN